MSLNRSLVFAFCFILVLALTLRLETELIRSDRQKIDLSAQALQLSERIRQEANMYSLVQKAFSRFRDTVAINYKTLFRYGWPPDYLKKELPLDSLAVALVDNQGVLVESSLLAGDIDSEFLAKFVYIDYLKTHKYAEDVLFSAKHQALRVRADNLLGEYIGAPVDRVAFMQMRAGRLVTFSSAEQLIGVYWDKIAVSPEHNVYFLCRLNLHQIPPLHIYQTLTSSELDANFAVAFFDSRRKEFAVGDGFPVVRSKSDFIVMKNACSDFVNGIASSGKTGAVIIRKKRLLIVVGREVAGTGLLPVVVTSLDGGAARHAVGPLDLAFFAMVCLALFTFVQTSVFSRGVRLSVGKVLIMASLLAILMPFLMGRSIFQLILREASDNERLKIDRNLYNTLAGLDSGIRLYNAALFQSFLRSFAHPETLSEMKKARELQAVYDRDPSTGDSIDLKQSDHAVTDIAERAFAPFLKGYDATDTNERRANAILIMGPNNFTRYYDRFQRQVVGHHADSRNDSMFVILNLYRKTLEKFFATDEFADGLAEKGGARSNEMEKVVYDEIKAQLVSSVGVERYYETFSRLEGLNSMRTSIGATMFAVFPLRIDGLIEYFCGLGWDEYAIGESYIKSAFTNIVNNQTDLSRHVSLLDLLDPASLIKAAPVLVQAFSGYRAESFSSQDAESSNLSVMIRGSARSRRLLRRVGTGDDQAIYQVLPGRYLSLYTVGGRQDISHLEWIEFWRHLIFMVGMFLFAIFAVFAAVNISRSFTGPLEHLLLGLNQIEAGNYNVKLKDSREDEFGSISRAFNRMVKSLRERNALGSFVSESVRRLARSPELFEKAQQGSEAKFTILFADFEGFAEFSSQASEQEVHRKLEFSLSHFFRYAEEYGGEVDKVIGEKLLITFSHEQLGKKVAALAAIKLAKRIVADFKADKNIKPVFGINSGRVISGIIGTPEVRVDNTVIGDPVNVAARMCSLATSSMPVIISGAIRDCLGSGHPVKPVAVEKIRGKKQEVEVFSLVM